MICSAALGRLLDGGQDTRNVVHSGQCTALEVIRLQLRRSCFARFGSIATCHGIYERVDLSRVSGSPTGLVG